MTWEKKCQTRKKIYNTKMRRMERKRETEEKSEPFSIFSHTIDCFAYPSVLSPGAAKMFITRFICCGVCGGNEKKNPISQSESTICAAVVCFRSFIVQFGTTTFSNGNQIGMS